MEKNMIVAMSCTANWYRYLTVDLYSLLECTKTIKKIYLLIETDDYCTIPFLEQFAQKYDVEIVAVSAMEYVYKYLEKSSPNYNSIYSNFCFSRLVLADVVKEDKVLYIDTDAIVRKDISNVWKYDLSSYYVAGVEDIGVFKYDSFHELHLSGKYINSGFVVFNLKKIREENIVSKWFDVINARKLRFPDQDALNYVCTNHEYYLSSMYNQADGSTVYVCNHDLVKVFHYTGSKKNWVVDRLYGEEWYDAQEKFFEEYGFDAFSSKE